MTLDVAAGETIAFVGPSGAGKTTICSLLPRFYAIASGRIPIDGIDIRDMTLASLRGRIGIVRQDVLLFAGTIRENVSDQVRSLLLTISSRSVAIAHHVHRSVPSICAL